MKAANASDHQKHNYANIPTSNSTASSRKSLDMEPNPFEQSFAQQDSNNNTSNHQAQQLQQQKKVSRQQGSIPHIQHVNLHGNTTNGTPQSDDKRHVPGLSPPMLTPGGTRRLPPTSVLPPLVGMMTPGGGSLPGTPGMWYAFFGNGAGGSGSGMLNGNSGAQGPVSTNIQAPNVTAGPSNTNPGGTGPGTGAGSGTVVAGNPPIQTPGSATSQFFSIGSLGQRETKPELVKRPSNELTGYSTAGTVAGGHKSAGGFGGLAASIPAGFTGLTGTPGGSLPSLGFPHTAVGAAGFAGSVAAQVQSPSTIDLKLPTKVIRKRDSDSTGEAASKRQQKNAIDNNLDALERRDSSKSLDKMAAGRPRQSSARSNPSKKGVHKRKSRTGLSVEEKRRNFLERNRLAASKCRRRKKQMVEKMKEDLKFYSSQYATLTSQLHILSEHVLTFRAILYAHKKCPKLIEQVGGVDALNSLLSVTYLGNITQQQQQQLQQQQQYFQNSQQQPQINNVGPGILSGPAGNISAAPGVVPSGTTPSAAGTSQVDLSTNSLAPGQPR